MTTNPDALPQLLTIDQLADHLGSSPRHARRLVTERRVRYLKVGLFACFHPAEIVAWLDDQRRGRHRVGVSMYRLGRRVAGGVDKLPSGRWPARHRKPDGRRLSGSFATKADADAWLVAPVPGARPIAAITPAEVRAWCAATSERVPGRARNPCACGEPVRTAAPSGRRPRSRWWQRSLAPSRTAGST